ncbi:hypothetical protein ACHAXN_004749 [Cyclotella atomus]
MKPHLTDKLIIILFILLSVILMASGQVDVEEVTDLDAAAIELNELLDALEGEYIESSSSGGADEKNEDCDASIVDETPAVEESESDTSVIDEKVGGTMEQQQEDGGPADNNEANQTAASETDQVVEQPQQPPAQTGPFVDLFGDVLLSLEMVDETHAQVHQHFTNEALANKKVVGLYFSADWCGPCRQFTPDLVQFYDKMNSRRGKQNEFEIVWISRCRSVDDFGQYFTHMKWLALPPQEAMGQRGQYLGEKYGVKSIPTLVLLDEIGNVITTDARNKIPMDKAGIGFPWRSPISVLVSALVPRSMRLLMKSQVNEVVDLLRKVLGGANNAGGGGGLGGLFDKLRESLAKKAGAR